MFAPFRLWFYITARAKGGAGKPSTESEEPVWSQIFDVNNKLKGNLVRSDKSVFGKVERQERSKVLKDGEAK